MKLPNKVEKLLLDTPESFYWIGFLVADGHFSVDNRITLALSASDLPHLVNFAKFIEYDNIRMRSTIYKSAWLAVMDKSKISEIRKRFSISNNKTEEPIKLPKITDELFLAFIIGFIDGDGCISLQTNRKDSKLAIKLHGAWKSTLDSWIRRLYKIARTNLPAQAIRVTSGVKINKSGYAEINVANSQVLWFMKEFIFKYQLPHLGRKWNKVKEPSTRTFDSLKLKEQIFSLRKAGLSYRAIEKTLKVSRGYISKVVRDGAYL